MTAREVRVVETTPRSGFRRELAALYCGVSPRHFDDLVKAGLLPRARRLEGIKIWLTVDLDAALQGLPFDGETTATANEWDNP